MNVSDLMTTNTKSCSPNDTLQDVARIMWENDCGVVPVVEADQHVNGMITDRDVCMASYLQGRPIWEIPVSSAMAKSVHGVREDKPLEAAETLMRRVQVRRVPVLDGGGRLRGILSISDLARHAQPTPRTGNGLSSDSIVPTLAAISAARVGREGAHA